MGTLATVALNILGKYWLYLILLGVIGAGAIAYKIKVDALNDANQTITTLKAQIAANNEQIANLKGQITNLDNAVAIQNNSIAQLKADSDAKQVQLNTLAKNLQDLNVKQAATVKALEAAMAPKTDDAIVTYLQDTLQGVVTWSNTLDTSQ